MKTKKIKETSKPKDQYGITESIDKGMYIVHKAISILTRAPENIREYQKVSKYGNKLNISMKGSDYDNGRPGFVAIYDTEKNPYRECNNKYHYDPSDIVRMTVDPATDKILMKNCKTNRTRKFNYDQLEDIVNTVGKIIGVVNNAYIKNNNYIHN